MTDDEDVDRGVNAGATGRTSPGPMEHYPNLERESMHAGPGAIAPSRHHIKLSNGRENEGESAEVRYGILWTIDPKQPWLLVGKKGYFRVDLLRANPGEGTES